MNMFTGIVQGKGTVFSVVKRRVVSDVTTPAGLTFGIELPDAEGLLRGASVAVNGVCLTATGISGNRVQFDVIPETLQRTNLGSLEVGSPVNIERSLKMGDELGGHLLSGHIMGVGVVTRAVPVGDGRDLTIQCPENLLKYIHEKGYIGLNGASLTVGLCNGAEINVHLIPETLRLTTFGAVEVGDEVNVEIDSMTQTVVATVERMLKQENQEGTA